MNKLHYTRFFNAKKGDPAAMIKVCNIPSVRLWKFALHRSEPSQNFDADTDSLRSFGNLVAKSHAPIDSTRKEIYNIM